MPSFVWLIEAPGPTYLAARNLGGYNFHWVADANAALKFCDETQADLTMMAIRELKPEIFGFEVTLGNAKAREHGYMVEGMPGLTRVSAPAEADGWRFDMENAPKDGTAILVAGGTVHFHDDSVFPYEGNATSVSIARWQTSGGFFEGWLGDALEGHDNFIEHRPTAWRPLPAPPTAREGD